MEKRFVFDMITKDLGLLDCFLNGMDSMGLTSEQEIVLTDLAYELSTASYLLGQGVVLRGRIDEIAG